MEIVFRDDVRRFFLDTEFMEDGRTIELVSIGIVSERDDGPELYLVNSEANHTHANEWVRANVLPKLPPLMDARWSTRVQIRDAVAEYLLGDGGKLELWAYYGTYDHVALCQLFGRMVDLPRGIPMHGMDLKQLSVMLGNPTNPPQDPAGAHDALCDARWNRTLFRMLRARAQRSPSALL